MLKILEKRQVIESEINDFIDKVSISEGTLYLHRKDEDIEWNYKYYLLYEDMNLSLILKDFKKRYNLVLFNKITNKEIIFHINPEMVPLYCYPSNRYFTEIEYYSIDINELTEEELKFMNKFSIMKELRR